MLDTEIACELECSHGEDYHLLNLRSLISVYVSVGLPPGQGLRAKDFQFRAYIYMLFILDTVRSNGFELRRGNANKVKWNGFP